METFILSFEEGFLKHKDYFQFLAVLISVAFGVIGWLFTASKNRVLQRKQLSISILNDNRYEPVWVEATHSVFQKIKDSTFTKEHWKEIAQCAYDEDECFNDPDKDGNKDPREVLWGQIRTVLNSFEFAAMAINCKAVNQYVIKESWAYYYEVLYIHFKPYINEARELNDDPDLYVNFTNLALKWHPSLREKKGSPSNRIKMFFNN